MKQGLESGQQVAWRAPDGRSGHLCTAEEIYEMLLDKYRDRMEGGMNAAELSAALRSETDGAALDVHDIWQEMPAPFLSEQEWKRYIREAARIAGRDQLPPLARRILDEVDYEASINWREALQDFLRRSFERFDYTFSPADRRFAETDFLLPAFWETASEETGKLWFMADASGSVDDRTLTAVVLEIRACLEQLAGVEGRLSFFDTEVTEPLELRTADMAGFQLLDLQDYPGQGSALVGILDAFMDSKGIADPETFRGFCAPVVPLALIQDFCVRNSQELTIPIALSNYEENDWHTPLSWTLTDETGHWERNGQIPASVAQGDIATIGHITVKLNDLKTPQRLTLRLKSGTYHNYYHLWVYPDEAPESTEGIYITDKADEEMKSRLAAGERVLFLPSHDSIRNLHSWSPVSAAASPASGTKRSPRCSRTPPVWQM